MSTAVIAAFYLYRGSFWNKWQFSWTKFLFLSFCDSDWKIIWLLMTLFVHCWGNCVFCRKSTIFFIFFWFFFCFLIHFESWDQTFSFFYNARISTHLSKMHITCTYDSLVESWISVENCKCFFITLGLWAKLVLDFCGKKFGTALKTSLHTYRRPFRRGTHFEIKTTSVKSVSELDWKMFWLFTTVTCTFVNIAFYVSRTPSSYFFNRCFF